MNGYGFVVLLNGLLFRYPLEKLLAKNVFACVVAFVSNVEELLSTMNLRPASTPASHACCSRVLTTYMRAMSTADPASPDIGISAIAISASVLARASRPSRASNPPAADMPPLFPPIRT